MGSVLGTLICIYCSSGCQGSVVASSLAFHPPEPFYDILVNDDTKECNLILSEEVIHSMGALKTDNITAYTIVTKSKTTIPIIFIKCKKPNPKYTIIFSHGNATDCGAMMAVYAMMSYKLDVNVIAYDYTGYGPNWITKKNGTRPTEKQTYKDIECVYNWIIENKIVKDPSKEILLYGQSVGSGPSCYLSSRPKYPVAGVILHSPIMSGVRVLTASRLLCLCDIYPNIDRIKKVKCPVFIIHGEEDNEVHFFHGLKLQEKVPDSYKYEPW